MLAPLFKNFLLVVFSIVFLLFLILVPFTFLYLWLVLIFLSGRLYLFKILPDVCTSILLYTRNAFSFYTLRTIFFFVELSLLTTFS